jgi:hypothetical protein
MINFAELAAFNRDRMLSPYFAGLELPVWLCVILCVMWHWFGSRLKSASP